MMKGTDNKQPDEDDDEYKNTEQGKKTFELERT